MRHWSLSASQVNEAPSELPSVGPEAAQLIFLSNVIATCGVLIGESGPTIHIRGDTVTVPRKLRRLRSKRAPDCSVSWDIAAPVPLTSIIRSPSGGAA